MSEKVESFDEFVRRAEGCSELYWIQLTGLWVVLSSDIISRSGVTLPAGAAYFVFYSLGPELILKAKSAQYVSSENPDGWVEYRVDLIQYSMCFGKVVE